MVDSFANCCFFLALYLLRVWLGSDYQTELAKYIDSKSIPKYAGGSSKFNDETWARKRVEAEEKMHKQSTTPQHMDFGEDAAEAKQAAANEDAMERDMESAAAAGAGASTFDADDDAGDDDDDDEENAEGETAL